MKYILFLLVCGVTFHVSTVNAQSDRSVIQTDLENSVARIKDGLRKVDSQKSNSVKEALTGWKAEAIKPGEQDYSIYQMLKGLGLCLGVFCLGIALLKKFNPKVGVRSEERIKIVSRVSVSSKTQLVLARVNNAEVLLAVGPEQVAFHSFNRNDLSSKKSDLKVLGPIIECGEEMLCEDQFQQML